MLWLLCICLVSVSAYLEETYNIDINVKHMHVRDSCTLYSSVNMTILKFHNESTPLKRIEHVSSVVSMNQECNLVAFGHPEVNKVVLWRPFKDTIEQVTSLENVTVNNKTSLQNVTKDVVRHHLTDVKHPRPDAERFGFSLDVQKQTWVVGAPGQRNDQTGNGATMGYAFVFEGNELHSCRSLYDSYCFKVGTECKTGFVEYKRYFGKRYPPLLGTYGDANVDAFQKNCTEPVTGGDDPSYLLPIAPSALAYFHTRQFGYSVALVGALSEPSSTLYISAPGDTHKFMEDSKENYGRVYIWDNVIWNPQEYVYNSTIYWWQMSVRSPLRAPPGKTAVYRAFGRKVAASRFNLAVSSYPLYFDEESAFVFVYNCHKDVFCKPGLCDSPNLLTESNCIMIPQEGIALKDLKFPAMFYMTPKMKAYSDPYAARDYIASDLDPNLGDFQNNFMGKDIGVAGSNVLIPDHHNGFVYRMGTDGKLRENHYYRGAMGHGSDSEHWAHSFYRENTHLWPCKRGEIGGRLICIPVERSYYSNDGWLKNMDFCPVNYTTTQKGRTKCDPWKPPPLKGLSWKDTVYIMTLISLSAFGVFFVMVAWQCICVDIKRRKDRYDIMLV